MITHLHQSFFTPRLAKSAFSLVEVTLALGVASFSLLLVLGLLPVGLSTSQRAVNSTEAMLIANHVMQDLVSAAEMGGAPLISGTYGVQVKKGESTVFVSREGKPVPVSGAIYKVIVTIGEPIRAGLNSNAYYAPACFSRVKVMCPAPADEANSAGSVTTPFTLRF